jgi:hypothetical protein
LVPSLKFLIAEWQLLIDHSPWRISTQQSTISNFSIRLTAHDTTARKASASLRRPARTVSRQQTGGGRFAGG